MTTSYATSSATIEVLRIGLSSSNPSIISQRNSQLRSLIYMHLISLHQTDCPTLQHKCGIYLCLEATRSKGRHGAEELVGYMRCGSDRSEWRRCCVVVAFAVQNLVNFVEVAFAVQHLVNLVVQVVVNVKFSNGCCLLMLIVALVNYMGKKKTRRRRCDKVVAAVMYHVSCMSCRVIMYYFITASDDAYRLHLIMHIKDG